VCRKARSPRAVLLAALCAVFVAALDTTAASAATQGFYIYNFTGATLKVTDVHVEGPEPVFEPVPEGQAETNVPVKPQVGDLLSPGERMHVELISKFSIVNNSNLRLVDLNFKQFPAPKSPTGRDYSVIMETGESNVLSSQVDMNCVVRGPNQCPVHGTTAKLLDPPGTHITIPATDSPQQSAALVDVCTKEVETTGGTCKFDPKQRDDNAFTPEELVSEALVNCDPHTPTVVKEEIEHKVGTTTSFEHSYEAENEFKWPLGKAKIAIKLKWGHEWLDEHTFTKKIEYDIEPLHVGWVEHAAPVVRYTGDFTMTVGNTTFTLTGVYFDHADKNRKGGGAYFRKQEKATPNDLRGCKGRTTGAMPVSRSALKTASSGTAGSDLMRGGPEGDVLRGLGGNDSITGGGGNDSLFAGPGGDLLLGGAGHDVLEGGPGADMIVDTLGSAMVRSGTRTGDAWDYVYVRDGRPDDTVICGSRHTYVVADQGDRVHGPCGEVIRRGPIRHVRLPVG
jgi:hypothetical protein